MGGARDTARARSTRLVRRSGLAGQGKLHSSSSSSNSRIRDTSNCTAALDMVSKAVSERLSSSSSSSSNGCKLSTPHPSPAVRRAVDMEFGCSTWRCQLLDRREASREYQAAWLSSRRCRCTATSPCKEIRGVDWEPLTSTLARRVCLTLGVVRTRMQRRSGGASSSASPAVLSRWIPRRAPSTLTRVVARDRKQGPGHSSESACLRLPGCTALHPCPSALRLHTARSHTSCSGTLSSTAPGISRWSSRGPPRGCPKALWAYPQPRQLRLRLLLRGAAVGGKLRASTLLLCPALFSSVARSPSQTAALVG